MVGLESDSMTSLRRFFDSLVTLIGWSDFFMLPDQPSLNLCPELEELMLESCFLKHGVEGSAFFANSTTGFLTSF